MTFKPFLLSALALLGCLAAGCSQKTLDSAQQDAQHNAATVNDQAQRIEKKARPAINNFGLQTRVTTALQANAKLPGTIAVRADSKGVYLRGTVKTVEQKALAQRVAEDTVPSGKTVTNDLEVRP